MTQRPFVEREWTHQKITSQLALEIHPLLSSVRLSCHFFNFSMEEQSKRKSILQAWNWARFNNYDQLGSVLSTNPTIGVDPDSRIYEDNVDPQSLLQIAAFSNSIGCIDKLIANKANIELRNFNGYTALHFAAYAGSLEALRKLICEKANIEARTIDGKTPLHIAAGRGHLNVVEELIKSGAKIDSCDCEGSTPLFHALIGNHRKTVELLLKNHADPYHLNADKVTASIIATQYKRTWFKTENI